MERPLLQHYEMTIISNALTVQNVLTNHELILENGGNTETKTGALIDILGGMDCILKYYLTNNDNINSEQLNKINNILLSINKIQIDDSHTEPMDTKEPPLVYLSSHDTILHRWLCTAETADKIMKFYTGNIMTIFGTIIALTMLIDYCMTYWFWNKLSYNIYQGLQVYSIVTVCIAIIYMLIAITNMNIKAVKHISNSFEAWFKLFYYIRGSVCWIIWQHRVHGNGLQLYLININLLFIGFMLTMFVYTFIDGFYVSMRYKRIASVVGAILFTAGTLSFMWAQMTNHHTKRSMEILGLEIDILSWASSSMRVVTIFVWKQTIYSLLKPEKAIMIKRSVLLKWH
eukprot:168346_1